MTRDELKGKIANMIRDTTYRNPQMFVKHGDVSLFSTRLAKRILALIEGERCEWTLIGNEMGSDFYRTSCGEASFVLNKYCRYCGKRIEVKGE